MKKYQKIVDLTLIVVFLIFSFTLQALAQSGDGSADGTIPPVDDTGSTTPAGTSTAPTDPTPTPTPYETILIKTTTTTPEPTTVKIEIPPVSIVAEIESPIRPITSSSNNSTLITVAGVIVLGVLGFFGLKLKKNKEQKKNDIKCLNFKKLMEDKLEELTDLKSKVTSGIQNEIRKELRKTSGGELLIAIEKVEKEYNNFKKLYEKCIVDLEKTKIEYLSYLMGAENITEKDLENLDIKIEKKSSNGHFMIKIPENKLLKYTKLVKSKLTNGFWNEIVGQKEIIFIFKFKDNHINEYRLIPENEKIIAKLCSEFNKDLPEETQNVYKYLSKNNFYHDFMVEHYRDLINR